MYFGRLGNPNREERLLTSAGSVTKRMAFDEMSWFKNSRTVSVSAGACMGEVMFHAPDVFSHDSSFNEGVSSFDANAERSNIVYGEVQEFTLHPFGDRNIGGIP